MSSTYSIPDEARFVPLRREAEFYLQPLGFTPGRSGRSALHLSIEAGGEENESYSLHHTARKGQVTLALHARGTRGAAHGFHHLLRLLGFGFSFFSDARPTKASVRWPYPGSLVVVEPEFSVRGFLPWHNFLNGPSAWNDKDYERHFLTLWRWGGNTAMFRNDNYEPLAAMRDEKGKWILGRKMETSIDAPWGGKKGVPVKNFALGTGKFFKNVHKGSWGAQHAFAEDPIQAAQDGFARACRFGKSIGLDVAFGMGSLKEDPTTPGIKELFRKCIAHILRTYPDLHTLCCWHPEGNGQRGWPQAAGSPGYAALERKYGKYFRYMAGSERRICDAVRTADWFMFVYEAAREIRPSIKIAFSGWGGDNWMRWGDYWRGLHEILPSDVTLAQLDNINPSAQKGVSHAVAGLSRQREFWSIPWLESDSSWLGRASQWHPQDEVAKIKELAGSARQLGYRGLLGIHWQTAGVELNAACLAGAGWNTRETAATFYQVYARTFFSPKTELAKKVAKILQALEALGPGWTGTGQQVECMNFDWDPFPEVTSGPLPPGLKVVWKKMAESRHEVFACPAVDFRIYCNYDSLLFSFNQKRGDPAALDKLKRLRADLAALKLDSPHSRRWLATMDFVIAYELIRRDLMAGGKLKLQQELIKEAAGIGLQPDPRLVSAYRKGVARINGLWEKVFAAQTSRLDATSDWGNLANLSLKAYESWIVFQDEIRNLKPNPAPTP